MFDQQTRRADADIRRRQQRRGWMALGMGLAATALLALLALAGLGLTGNGPLQDLEPDHQAKAVARQYARATAELRFADAWSLYDACYQQVNPEGPWVALKESETRTLGASAAPADTRYDVVAVTTDSGSQRVQMRVTTADGRQLTYEVDVRNQNGREVVVDEGDIGHPMANYDCAPKAGGR